MIAIESTNDNLVSIAILFEMMGKKNISQPYDNIIIGNTILLTGNDTYYYGTSSANWNRNIIITIHNSEIYDDKGRDIKTKKE